jgi:hypothetical protein
MLTSTSCLFRPANGLKVSIFGRGLNLTGSSNILLNNEMKFN